MKRQQFMTSKRAICLIAAILMTLSCVLFTGCGKNREKKDEDGKIGTAPVEQGEQVSAPSQDGEIMIGEPEPVPVSDPEPDFPLQPETEKIVAVAAWNGSSFGLRADGTVVACGDYDGDVSDWTDIVAIETESRCLYGIRSDGTVLTTNDKLRDVVSGWTDVVAVIDGYDFAVALKKDGTVVSTGRYDVSSWTDVIAIDGTSLGFAALRKDGTVLAQGSSMYYDLKDVPSWTDMVAISVGGDQIAGLRADGTVATTGSRYREAEDWTDIVAIDAGEWHLVGLRSDGTVVATGDGSYGGTAVHNWEDVASVLVYGTATYGIRKDGTVVSGGVNLSQFDSSDWTDIVAIAVSANHAIGLKSDGSVVAAGKNDYGQCDVADWYRAGKHSQTAGKPNETEAHEEIPADLHIQQLETLHETISMGGCTVAVKNDGTVVAYGGRATGSYDVSDWTDIIAVSAGTFHIVGLKKDGTVVSTSGMSEMSDWKDIVAVRAGLYWTVGLKKDGTLVSTSRAPDVSGWKDIVLISTRSETIVGLKRDGTVVAAGDNTYGQCNVSDWKDIVAIKELHYFTVGIRKDGTAVTCGRKDHPINGYHVTDWSDIQTVADAQMNRSFILKKDGTVYPLGDNYEVRQWKGIVALVADSDVIGLKADGTVISCRGGGDRANGYEAYSQWSDICLP